MECEVPPSPESVIVAKTLHSTGEGESRIPLRKRAEVFAHDGNFRVFLFVATLVVVAALTGWGFTWARCEALQRRLDEHDKLLQTLQVQMEAFKKSQEERKGHRSVDQRGHDLLSEMGIGNPEARERLKRGSKGKRSIVSPLPNNSVHAVPRQQYEERTHETHHIRHKHADCDKVQRCLQKMLQSPRSHHASTQSPHAIRRINGRASQDQPSALPRAFHYSNINRWLRGRESPCCRFHPEKYIRWTTQDGTEQPPPPYLKNFVDKGYYDNNNNSDDDYIDGGLVRIYETGHYYVYAQLSFNGKAKGAGNNLQSKSFTVVLKKSDNDDKLVTLLRGSITQGIHDMDTVYSGGVFRLEPGDMIGVLIPPDTANWQFSFIEGGSFFGAFMIK